VSFQHLTLLGADAPSGSGDLIFSSEKPASWPSSVAVRGDPRQFLLDSGRASATASEGTNQRTQMWLGSSGDPKRCLKLSVNNKEFELRTLNFEFPSLSVASQSLLNL